MQRSPILVLSLAMTVSGMVGCGGSPTDGFSGPRGQVEGTITYDGKPVPGGTGVLFLAPSTGYNAVGEVKEGGHYSLVYRGSANLPAVDYEVQLSPPPPQPVPASEAPAVGPAPIVKVPEPFPVKYLSANTGKLKFTVKEGKNIADFPLTK